MSEVFKPAVRRQSAKGKAEEILVQFEQTKSAQGDALGSFYETAGRFAGCEVHKCSIPASAPVDSQLVYQTTQKSVKQP
jgi:hypothetical protein